MRRIRLALVRQDGRALNAWNLRLGVALGKLAASGAINPIVASQQPFRPHRAHADVARQRQRTGHMVQPCLRLGFLLHPRDARRSPSRIGGEGFCDILRRGQTFRENPGVLDRLAGALREEGQHRMSGVAEQGDAAAGKIGKGGA